MGSKRPKVNHIIGRVLLETERPLLLLLLKLKYAYLGAKWGYATSEPVVLRA